MTAPRWQDVVIPLVQSERARLEEHLAWTRQLPGAAETARVFREREGARIEARIAPLDAALARLAETEQSSATDRWRAVPADARADARKIVEGDIASCQGDGVCPECDALRALLALAREAEGRDRAARRWHDHARRPRRAQQEATMSETTCPDCGHTHEGANLANICVGCPCERRDLGAPDRVVHGLTPVAAPRLSPRWSQLAPCPDCGRARATSPAPEPAPCVGCEKATESLAGWRHEVMRLRDVIRTGGAMLRAERAILGVPGGVDPAPDQDADGASHDLKTWPEPFEAILNGRKRYEIRRFDRSFAVGDRLVLREWNPVREDYTGRVIAVRVSYLTAPGNWGLPDDVGVLGIVVDRAERDTASTVDKLADAAALAELEAAARNLLACATAPEPVAAAERAVVDALAATRGRP